MKRFQFLAILITLSAILSGCVSMGSLLDPQVIPRKKYVANHPNLDEETKQSILGGKVHVGMTKEEVIASWGDTSDKNQSISFWGTSEMWTYGGCTQYGCNMNMVTFSGDKVTSLNSSRS